MNKSELIANLSIEHSDLSNKLIESAVKEVFKMLRNALATGERIEIRGFGSFDLRYRQARHARNPKTGELVTTKAKYTVHFKPGKELKERVDSNGMI